MRLLHKVFSGFVLIFLLAACAGQNPAPRVYAHGGPVWRAGTGGGLTHLPSGVIFPEKTMAYKRGQVTDFAENGSDVGLTYDALAPDENGFRGEITFYVTYGPALPAPAYMAAAVQAIRNRFGADIAPVQEDSFVSETDNLPPGLTQIFRIGLNGKPYRTGVWVSRRGDWLFKARFTYPEAADPVANDMAPVIAALAAVGWAGADPQS